MFNLLGGAYVLFAVLTWAISSIGYKNALGAVGVEEKKSRDPIASLGVRILVLLIFVILYVAIFGDLKGLFSLTGEARNSYIIITIVCGILTVLGDICYFYALRYLDSSRVYPLINTQTLFTIPFAYFIFGESIPSLMWLASFLMIGGVFFVGGMTDNKDIGMENIKEEHHKKNYIIGVLLGIGTGFFFGTQYLTMTAMNNIFPGIMESNMARIVMYAILLWGYILLRRKHLPKRKTEMDKKNFRAYVLTGLFGILSFGIGDAIYQLGVELNGAAISIIIASSAPIFNQLLSILFLKEKFRKNFLIGVIFIIIGNILVIF